MRLQLLWILPYRPRAGRIGGGGVGYQRHFLAKREGGLLEFLFSTSSAITQGQLDTLMTAPWIRRAHFLNGELRLVVVQSQIPSGLKNEASLCGALVQLMEG